MNFTTFLISLAIIGAAILAGFYLILKKFKENILGKKDENSDSQSMLMLQNQINEMSRAQNSSITEMNRMLDSKLTESTRVLQHQFGESAKIITEITRELTKVGEGQKQVVDVAKQLENLQDILKNPKQRGVLGEYYLKSVLENVLAPKSFQMQYAFKNGDIVDAVIFIKDKIIPIDSKFSLENYNRLINTKEESERKRLEDSLRQDLKNRIDETSKYIKPSEGTMDFAFMFIPSEALYYDLLINKVGAVNARDLVEYAMRDKKVVVVSPTSFLAYLQTVLQGLKAMQIEETAQHIIKRVGDLGKHIGSYEVYMQKLGTHLGTSVNMYNSAYKELGKIDKDVLRITGDAVEIEPMVLPKPELEIDE